MNPQRPLPELIISDTTLRDGEQMPHAALTPEEKLEIAHALAKAGVRSIDAGFPATSDEEIEAVHRIAASVRGPVIMALCRALESDIDAALRAFEGTQLFRCAAGIFLATSPVHREKKLNKTRQQILDLTRSSITYARRRFRLVTFSAEDASRTEPDFLAEVYGAAIEAGANVIAYPDTVGILTPEKARDAVTHLLTKVPGIEKARLAVHFHNDLGMATANTLAAVQAGAHIVQCTVNGIGERAGNAPLEEVALALTLNPEQYGRSINIRTSELTALSRLVAEKTGIPVAPHKAVVGSNIFATEAGIHQDGLLKDFETYLPFAPELIGQQGIRLVLGRHCGRAAIRARYAELGVTLSDGELAAATSILRRLAKSDWQDPDAALRQAWRQVQSDLSTHGEPSQHGTE
jgi:2-isopropylmalate synthase